MGIKWRLFDVLERILRLTIVKNNQEYLSLVQVKLYSHGNCNNHPEPDPRTKNSSFQQEETLSGARPRWRDLPNAQRTQENPNNDLIH